MNQFQQNSYPLIKKIENYTINLHQKIGQGSFSQVFKGINLNNQNHVAVKKIRTADIKSKIAKRLLEWQKSLLKNIDHPNIIKCLDIHDSLNNCYIITEFCSNGDLDAILKQQKTIKPEKVAKIIYSIFQALQYLYQRAIIHRDLKLSNIFVHQDNYKLGDFGFAIKSDKMFKDIAVGSPVYMSPQGLLSNLYGPKTDIWSLGILIYEILHGKAPLASCTSEQQLKRKVVQQAPIRHDIDKDLLQLLKGCLKINQSERFGIRQISKCTYIMRIRGYEKMDIQKDLTLTKQTMCSSTSDKNYLNLSQISYETALALMQYCRLLNQIISSIKPNHTFSRYLILISTHLKLSHIKGNIAQQKSKNLKDIIKQYNQNYINQYGSSNNCIASHINLSELLSQCQKQMNFNSKERQYIKNLYKETQLLQKCADLGMIQTYSKKSKAKIYLAQIKV